MTRKRTGTTYEAEWIIEIHEPPSGCDFDPLRDVEYGRREFASEINAAKYAQANDLNGEGHVSEYTWRRIDGYPLRQYVNSRPAYEILTNAVPI